MLEVIERQLTIAPGTKLQGYVDWSQSPQKLRCDEGHSMEHLLTIASWEPVWPRWRPVEEGNLYHQLWTAELFDEANTLSQPHGMMLGEAASKHIFICRRCADWPITSIIRD